MGIEDEEKLPRDFICLLSPINYIYLYRTLVLKIKQNLFRSLKLKEGSFK